MKKLPITTVFATAGAIALATITAVNAAETPESGRKLSTTLTGAAEAPGPGDSDGSGTFTARVNPGQGQLCYELKVQNIAAATAAHIHIAPVGAPGPVVVPLAAPSLGESKDCADIDRELALALIKTPENYYVNVHNADHPAGAIRGQLAK